jgi:hypothetical protein
MEYWENGFSRIRAFNISGGQRLKIEVSPAFIPNIPVEYAAWENDAYPW